MRTDGPYTVDPDDQEKMEKVLPNNIVFVVIVDYLGGKRKLVSSLQSYLGILKSLHSQAFSL